MGKVSALYSHDPLKLKLQKAWNGVCPSVDREWLSKTVDEKKAAQRP